MKTCTYYRVKKNQTVRSIACAYGCPVCALAACNELRGEVCEGQIVKIPSACNLYTVRGGESRELLCGSAERFEEKNGTRWLYPTQKVFL